MSNGTHGLKDGNNLKSQNKKTCIKTSRRILEPRKGKAADPLPRRLEQRERCYAYSDSRTSQNICRRMVTQVYPRHANEQEHVCKCHHSRGSPGKKYRGSQSEEHRGMVAGKCAPVDQVFIAMAVRRLKMKSGDRHRPFMKRQEVCQGTGHQHRQ